MKTDARVSRRSLGTALGRGAGAGDALAWRFDGEGPSDPSCADRPGLGLVLEELGFRPSWAGGHTAGDAVSHAVGKEPAPACFSTDLGTVQPVPSSSCCPSVSFALCDGNEKSPNLQPPTYVLLPTRSG